MFADLHLASVFRILRNYIMLSDRSLDGDQRDIYKKDVCNTTFILVRLSDGAVFGCDFECEQFSRYFSH